MSKKRLREVRIDPARVQELINYDPDTGEFTWKVARGGRAKDSKAGSSQSIHIDGMTLTLPTVAFICVTGCYPKAYLYRINGDLSDNRWCNLIQDYETKTQTIDKREVYENVVRFDLSDVDRLYEMYEPDFELGTLTWKVRPLHHFKSVQAFAVWNNQFAGKKAGCATREYVIVKVGSNATTMLHRVLWTMYHRKPPSKHIDHIDRNTHNNSIHNLREAEPYQNQANQKVSVRNTTGYKGVYYDKSRGLYAAKISFKGKIHHLGRFKTAEDAFMAYCTKAKELNPEFYSLGLTA